MKTLFKKSVFVAGLIVLSSPFISCDNSKIKKEKKGIAVAKNLPITVEKKTETSVRNPIVFIAGFDKENENFYTNARTYFQEKGIEVIEGQYSLEEIIIWLNNHATKIPYGDINIVNESNPYKGMN